MAAAGRVVMQELMERMTDRDGPGDEQDHSQKTSERWSCQVAKAVRCSFPMHLYACIQAQTLG